MQDYPSYTQLNSYDYKNLSSYEQLPTVVSSWPAQQPIAALSKSDKHSRQDEMPGSLVDCLITVGLIMFLLISSSVMLGFVADRLTQGVVMLIRQQSETELVSR